MSQQQSNNNSVPNDSAVVTDERTIPNAWLVRPCECYKDEYSECSSIKGKFHQYFIHGETLDCSQWMKDYENCMMFRMQKDRIALEAVIESEKRRRINRLTPFYFNNVWTHRETPPEDWNQPLPQKMQEEYKNTYLDHKAREFRKTQS